MAPLYSEWLRYVFDRPVTPQGWYFDLEFEPFEARSFEIASLILETCSRSEVDLAEFTDQQVAAGLNYIFNNSCSDTVFALVDQEVPLDLRLEGLRSIESLYTGCFAKRCIEALSHTNEASDHPLNSVCYMLWDVFPFSVWDHRPHRELLFGHAVDLLGTCLAIGHVACTESALHGLGHMYSYSSPRVEAAIDLWLSKNKNANPSLRHYAHAARAGLVQ